MVDQTGEFTPGATGHIAPGPMSRAEAERMFRRMLSGWVLDCARLRRRGLDRPSLGLRRAPRRPADQELLLRGG